MSSAPNIRWTGNILGSSFSVRSERTNFFFLRVLSQSIYSEILFTSLQKTKACSPSRKFSVVGLWLKRSFCILLFTWSNDLLKWSIEWTSRPLVQSVGVVIVVESWLEALWRIPARLYEMKSNARLRKWRRDDFGEVGSFGIKGEKRLRVFCFVWWETQALGFIIALNFFGKLLSLLWSQKSGSCFTVLSPPFSSYREKRRK